MEKREQIIIGATVLAALYGAYEFIGKPLMGGPEITEGLAGIDLARVQEMTAVIEKDKALHDAVALTLSRAAEEWRNDAFYYRTFAVDSTEPLEETPDILPLDPATFVYSGLLQMQDKTIAIINGIDYTEQEALDNYRIETITPALITLSRNGQTFTLTPKEGNADQASNTKSAAETMPPPLPDDTTMSTDKE